MATTSLGSSTTQMMCGSRLASRQMRHSSASATLPQVRQNWTLSFTSLSASVSRLTSAGSAASRWKAIRCALLGPTPGSLPSSSMRFCTTPSYTRLHLPLPALLSAFDPALRPCSPLPLLGPLVLLVLVVLVGPALRSHE